MNILYLIGNGFDINIGLKTSYKDFYKYYNKKESSSLNIKDLKKSISSDIENWSDLEIALGRYTEKTLSEEIFTEIFEDIGDSLADYLNKEEKYLSYENINKIKFYKDLSYPELYLPGADVLNIKRIRNKNNQVHKIDLFTFNYTKVLDSIIKNKVGSVIDTGVKVPSFLRSIEHIHGYTEERMVMGVNDVSQIINKSFHNNLDVLNALVKEKCNKVMRHGVDDKCIEVIESADVICIFGSSIGSTDKIWWEKIGNALLSGTKLILFSRGEKIHPRRAYKNDKFENKIRERFLANTNLSKEKKIEAAKNIYVGINTDIFNILYEKK